MSRDRRHPGHDGGDDRGNHPPGESDRLWGLLAEFPDVQALFEAAERCRDAGYRRWDVHSPFPIHGMNNAMGLRYTKLPLLVLGGGLTGLGLALLMQWWMNAVDYPLIISGKPLFSLPANIPVLFELTVLLSALCAFIGMLAMNGLPRYHHPLFRSEEFRRATQDRFFLTVEASDPLFDETRVEGFLREIGCSRVERIGGEE
jgi:hypothetical protein